MEKVLVKGYEVTLCWDNEDSIFVATAVSLPGCKTHGDTQEEAVNEMIIAIEGHIENCHRLGKDIIEPMQIYA